MINLKDKIKQEKEMKQPQRKASFRSQLLAREIPDLGANTPPTCEIKFGDPDNLRKFSLIIRPDQGLWKGGVFHFDIEVPDEYNMKPPRVVCSSKVWHPNIAVQDGAVCLSLLRTGTPDGMGWTPARTLKEVIWGLNLLFTDLLNPDDPLNIEAAEQYRRDPESFKKKVRYFISQDRRTKQ